MYSKALALALALTSVVSAGPLNRRQDPCQDTYKSCVASGVPEVACACDLQACLGEDNARGREYCASATATIVRTSTHATPVTTSIPGGCNPAHPGSCPSSYFQTSVVAPTPTSIPGGCNPAHPGSCPSSYFSTVATPVATSIPGGCNPAHPGSCPTPSAVPVPAPGSNPVETDKTWAVNNLSRYCGEGNSGCDYNFVIEANGKTERCTVIRMPGKDAATESWSNQPCTSGSPYTISWGYAAQPAPAFAVMTVVNGKELAWFGVSDINGQKVTPSNPFGSGQYPNTTAPVYTYN
ncbi:hypothetical protein BU25DRAFT_92007 [Macroventuria anomochaeta]|uniref:Uncharacterized protein n=1 Tax=Macroventuria anomochaeta TaxID=301207 RepID=A0ACB6RX80_9PLEO|nr:uncharacterized protein BU25DRAFT_92007 [Macroventuria anomochaeta]KAF2626630.1 hypothetical protein BU25DRAFT_92007 [Macroventuria anomochaeta]